MTHDDPLPSVVDPPEGHWLRTAHKRSTRHRAEIEASTVCGCFHCEEIFAPSEIEDWIDTRNPMSEQTALCPRCGIDSVIGDKAGSQNHARVSGGDEQGLVSCLIGSRRYPQFIRSGRCWPGVREATRASCTKSLRDIRGARPPLPTWCWAYTADRRGLPF
jgi:hypothetical protein